MIISLWNSDLALTDAQVDLLQGYILDHLAACPTGRQSVSHLVSVIRDHIFDDTLGPVYIRFPTNHNDAMTTFKVLGFKVEGVPNAKHPRLNRMWEVTL
jgi:hypothetical protein